MVKTELLEVNWIHPNGVEQFLRKMAVGRTINVCCGMSRVGDVRIDLDPKTNRTENGDLFHINYPAMSFDTVICDPPFSYFNKFRWLRGLKCLARKRILISCPSLNLTVHFYGYSARLFAISKGTVFLRYYWCFDKENEILDANDN